MNRMAVWIALLLCAGMLSPGLGTDVAEIQPVQLIQVYTEGDNLIVETDTGDVGIGSSVPIALENLKNTTTGKIFLDTADYLLICETTEKYLPELASVLRPATEVCRVFQKVDGENAAAFLDSRKLQSPLHRVIKGNVIIPNLLIEEERFELA